MDDLDHALKHVRLQRERLALKRDIARDEARAAVGAAATRLARALWAPARGLWHGLEAGWRLARRWRWLLLLLVAVAAVAAAATVWKRDQDARQAEAADQVRRERWHAGRLVFIAAQCPAARFVCPEADVASHASCLNKATDQWDRLRCDNQSRCTARQRERLQCEEAADREYASRY